MWCVDELWILFWLLKEKIRFFSKEEKYHVKSWCFCVHVQYINII